MLVDLVNNGTSGVLLEGVYCTHNISHCAAASETKALTRSALRATPHFLLGEVHPQDVVRIRRVAGATDDTVGFLLKYVLMSANV